MDPSVIAIVASLVGAVAVLCVVYLVVRGQGRSGARAVEDLLAATDRLNEGQIALGGRLAQLAETQQTAQTQLQQRLQEQERVLSTKVEERLADLSRRMGESLQKSSQTTQTTITDLRERLAKIDEAQKNITALSSQVVGLQDILSNKQARGAFGEVQLIDLVSQVLPASHYEIQATLSNGRRADCLLKLPNPPGPIVVDAKFPLESYTAMLSAAGDEARTAAAKLFERDVRKHVRDIAERYLIPGETADQALMFLPSEAIYAELHTHFLGVVEEARRARVHIVSPNTFWALLTSVRAVLKDVQLREQTHLLQAEIVTMLGDVERLDDRVGKLERHFSQATEDIRLVRISADKVTKRGARIGELDLNEGAGDAIEPPLPTEAQLKLVDAGADRAE